MGGTNVKRVPPTVKKKKERNGFLTKARSVSDELFHVKQNVWDGNCGGDYRAARRGI